MSVPTSRVQVICAVCRRPVELFEVNDSPQLWAQTVYAMCHGKKDSLLFRNGVPTQVIVFKEEAEAIKAQQEQTAAAPADYFVCLSMLVTGRHKHPHLMLGLLDKVARDIAMEDAS